MRLTDDGEVTPQPERPLAMSDCLRECAWSTTDEHLGGERLFACGACGSQWVRTEAWTPIDWMGEVPEAVVAERARPV